MEKFNKSDDNFEKGDNKLKIINFKKQKNQLFDVKYENVKEFCDSLSPSSVSDFKEFVSWVESKFGNEKVKLSNGQECSIWCYLLICKNNNLKIPIKKDNVDFCCQLLKQDIEPTGWLTFFVCFSALFSVVIVGIPFFIILGEKLMTRNLRNEYKSMSMSGYIRNNFAVYRSPDYFLKDHNNSNQFPKNNLKSNSKDEIDFN